MSSFLTASTTLPSAALGAGQLTDADIYDTPCITAVFSPLHNCIYLIDTSNHQDELVFVPVEQIEGGDCNLHFINSVDERALMSAWSEDAVSLHCYDTTTWRLLSGCRLQSEGCVARVSQLYRGRQFVVKKECTGPQRSYVLDIFDSVDLRSSLVKLPLQGELLHSACVSWNLLHGVLCVVIRGSADEMNTLHIFVFDVDSASLQKVAAVNRDTVGGARGSEFPARFSHHGLHDNGTLVVVDTSGATFFVLDIAPATSATAAASTSSPSLPWTASFVSSCRVPGPSRWSNPKFSPCGRFLLDYTTEKRTQVFSVADLRSPPAQQLVPIATYAARCGFDSSNSLLLLDADLYHDRRGGPPVVIDAVTGRPLTVTSAPHLRPLRDDLSPDFFFTTNAAMLPSHDYRFWRTVVRYYRGRVVACHQLQPEQAAGARGLRFADNSARIVLDFERVVNE